MNDAAADSDTFEETFVSDQDCVNEISSTAVEETGNALEDSGIGSADRTEEESTVCPAGIGTEISICTATVLAGRTVEADWGCTVAEADCARSTVAGGTGSGSAKANTAWLERRRPN